VFVPGDGIADIDPGAKPIWEALGRAGYATVKWNKPGIGDSTGNWLDQDMDDRAGDVLSALSNHDELDLGQLGVMGASQGGWVIPLVAERIDVDFFVAWSTAIDWDEQGRYLSEREFDPAKLSVELRGSVRAADDAGDAAVSADSTYDDYLQWYDTLPTDIARFFGQTTEDRWGFVVRNRLLDARTTLDSMVGTPTLLLLGGRDENVDVADTERVYREILDGPCLDVRT
jgi:alpha-beta hydrolase superfamily lysophospholipase